MTIVSIRLAVVRDEGATKMPSTARKMCSVRERIFDFPTPGGATRMVYKFGYRFEPLVLDQTFRSITADTIPIAAHRRKISGV